ncbi:MAG: T9SS type A sorting domain-containing protein [Crocinitomicaceae bacterium]
MKTILTLLIAVATTVSFSQTTWYEVATGVDNKLNVIDFPSANVGYIGGNDTLLLKSIDGGKTWNPVNHAGLNVFPGGEDIVDLQFFSEEIGFMVVGPYGGTYKTVDGGLNWTAITVSGNLCYQEALFFFSENEGFIGGSGCFEGELIDLYDGSSTNQATMNDNGLGGGEAIVDIDFLNSNYGLAASSGGRIFRTTDGGNNWDSIPINVGQNATLNSIEITADSIAFAGISYPGGSNGVLKTTDWGLNWFIDTYTPFPVLTMNFHDTHLGSNGILYAPCTMISTSGFRIFENPDPGASWSGWNQETVGQPIYNMTSYADSVVWGVGDSGYVVVNTPPTSLSVWEYDQLVEFNLFPNPTNNVLNIELVGAGSNLRQITIYDLSGKKLMDLNPIQKQIDVSSLTTGVYLLEVKTDAGCKTNRFVKD